MKTDEPEAQDDVLLVHGIDEDGDGVRVLRKRGEVLEAGALRPLRENEPLTGELVTLRRRPEFPLLFDVETKVRSPLARRTDTAARSGPPRVTSERFRRGWDAIWGKADDEDDPLAN